MMSLAPFGTPFLNSAVYAYERSMNFNEIMFRLTYNKVNVSHENMKKFFLYTAFIGEELSKYQAGMFEMDPKNFFQNSEGDIKLGSCLSFIPPGVKLSDIQDLETENLR